MKKLVIRTIVLLSVFLIVYSFCFSTFNIVQAIDGAINRIGKGEGVTAVTDSTGENAIQKIIALILDVLRIFGAAVAIIILNVIAIKYIIASAGERADIKKYAINYVIGALIFLGASGILTLIRDTIFDVTAE